MSFTKITLLSVLFAITLLMSCSPKNVSSKEKGGWMSMNDVEEAVEKEQKYILVDIYTDWCPPCKMMDKKTFRNQRVKEALTHFHTVKFNAESNEMITFRGRKYSNPNFDPTSNGRNAQHELCGYFGVRGYPLLFVLDTDFNIVDQFGGYMTPGELISLLSKYK